MRTSFRKKMITLVCVFGILLVFMVSFISYRWHEEQMVVQTGNQTQQIIEQLGSNIDSYIDELFRLTLAPYYNDEVMKSLENSGTLAEEKLENRRKIENFLSSVMILPRDEILRVYLLSENDIYSYTRTPYEMEDYADYQETEWYRTAKVSSRPIFIPIHTEKVYGNRRTTVLSIARRIRSKENNNKILGVIKVDADYSAIESLADKISFEYNGALLMINSQGETVYQQSGIPQLEVTEDMIQQIRIGNFYVDAVGQKYICNSTQLEESGIMIIALNSYDDIVRVAMRNMSRAIIPVTISFAAALVILVVLMRRFFHPLYLVIDAMGKVRGGELGTQVAVHNEDEIGYLADSFNTMTANLEQVMKRNTELVSEVYESNFRHKSSQYEALCAQIKPHFINNTLNTISLLIKCGEYQESVMCIESLSTFLSGVMQVDKDITIETEIGLAEAYLSICSMRYGEKLDYKISIEERFRDVWIPALTIQPIVENAMKHSCEKTSRKVLITVNTILSEDNLLHIVVEDDGVGIAPDMLRHIEKRMYEEDENMEKQLDRLTDNSIGLRNVHRRLRLKYGMKAGLQISSAAGHTRVDIIIPWEDVTTDV